MSREILVVKTDELFKSKKFQGFMGNTEFDFYSLILSKFQYKERNEELENNENFKQIIPYIWIVNKKDKNVFLYKRGMGNGEYKEKRYLNKYSGGIGGHIDKDTEEKSKDPIRDAMFREMNEEVLMKNYPAPKIVGYINDNSDSLGKVHFGVLGIAETNEDIKLAEPGLKEGRFYSIKEVDEIMKDEKSEKEGWTKISWPFVKGYLLK